MTNQSNEFRKRLIRNIDHYKRRIEILKTQLSVDSGTVTEESIRLEIKTTEEKLRLRQSSGMLPKEVEWIYNRRLQLLRMMLAKDIPYASVSLLLQIEEAEGGLKQLEKQLSNT